ncbi:MAG: host attachment protein [Sphingobacteriia bacterium]|nr:host attachment protein [Sphingobacteriia bacterium]
MIGILVANSSDCKLYTYSKPNHFTLLKHLTHEESRMKIVDLVDDDRGRPDKPFSSTRVTYEPNTDPKEKEWDKFAKEIANCIKSEQDNFDKMILIASPKFEGILKHKLDKKIIDKVSKTLTKDLLNMPEQEMLLYIEEHIS